MGHGFTSTHARVWVCVTHISLTSSDGRNRLSFSTTTTFLGAAFSTERVRAPGPGPTSQTQLSLSWPASLTSRSGVDVWEDWGKAVHYCWKYDADTAIPVTFKLSRKFWLSWDLAVSPYSLMMSETVGRGGSLTILKAELRQHAGGTPSPRWPSSVPIVGLERGHRRGLSSAAIASSPGHSQILSRSRGEKLVSPARLSHACGIKSGSGLGMRLLQQWHTV